MVLTALALLAVLQAPQSEPRSPVLEVVRAPARTEQPAAHVLGRATPGCRVTVGGREVDVYATGLFAADNLTLVPGENRIEIVAISADGRRAVRELMIERIEESPPQPRADYEVIEPGGDVVLREGELLMLRVLGPPGLDGRFRLVGTTTDSAADGPLTEADPGVYEGAIRVRGSAAWRVAFDFGSVEGERTTIEARAPVTVRDATAVEVAEVTATTAGLTYGLHDVRLGGPWLAHVPMGTRLEVVGRRGRALCVRLTPTRTAWVNSREVTLLPAGTPPPRASFTSCSIGGGDHCDRITIPLPAPLPFAVHAETTPSNRIVIDVFGAHHALTWVSHRADAQVLGDLVAEQVEDEHVRLIVPVSSKQIWGYWAERSAGALSIFVRHPPAWPDRGSVWSDLRIALEPGHGGSNSGAVGLAGTKEKDVNARAVEALERELVKRGAEVVVVRRGDEEIGLAERAERAVDAGAQWLVSIHANAASTSRGYLRVSGTSTYYHEPHCQRAAELVYRELLELGWNEFGCVGNFSYLPIRQSRVPGILVEQAFMSNPADEARLLDPGYLAAQAVAIANGLEAFFREVR